jgi:putative membrane protein
MKKLLLTQTAITALVGFCLLAPARAAEENTASSGTESHLSMNDKKFVKKAYKGGMEEIENAKMAKENAKSDATKDVAQQMITDHSKANRELEAIAKEENLDLSEVKAEPAKISETNFDKGYLTMLKKEHKKDIAMFEKEANDTKAGEDRDVPKFARKTVPILKEHLTMVEDALTKLK